MTHHDPRQARSRGNGTWRMRPLAMPPKCARAWTALVVGLLWASLLACSHHGEDTPQTVTAEKTLLAFMPYSGDSYNLYNNFLQNIGDMEQAIVDAGGLGNRRLLVFISRSASRADLVDITYRNGQCHRDTLRQYTNTTPTTATDMAAILYEAKRQAPAKQYALIVGSHGEGWLPPNQTKAPTTRYFGGTSSKYQIEISTLAEAITRAGMHMQFILFDDCYLSTVEVAYDLRHAADYLLASTSEVMAYGMPYRQMLPTLLSDNPDYDNVCQQFLDFYKGYVNKSGQPMPYGTLAATDLRQMDGMATLMRDINSLCSFDYAQLGTLQDLDAGHWNPTIYFDFGHYAELLCTSHPELYEQFCEQLSQLVTGKAATANIYSATDKTILPLLHFSGLSISDPSINENALLSKQQTAWWEATH